MALSVFLCPIYVRICVFSYLFIYTAAKVIINSTKMMHKIGKFVQFWVYFVKKVENFGVK